MRKVIASAVVTVIYAYIMGSFAGMVYTNLLASF